MKIWIWNAAAALAIAACTLGWPEGSGSEEKSRIAPYRFHAGLDGIFRAIFGRYKDNTPLPAWCAVRHWAPC